MIDSPARCGPGSVHTVTEHRIIHRRTSDRHPVVPALQRYLRLRRRAAPGPDGHSDGGWWPRSLDLAAELRPLLADLRAEGYGVERVVYHPAAWDPAPEAMTVAGRRVGLEGSRGGPGASISLIGPPGSARTDLVVIPPQTEPRIAERILALTERGDDLGSAAAHLARAPGLARGGDAAGAAEPVAVWEDEGGLVREYAAG